MVVSDLGIGASAPKKACEDRNCPFHGGHQCEENSWMAEW
jgi:hypothetical protein